MRVARDYDRGGFAAAERLKHGGEGECRTPAGNAFKPDAPTHQLDEFRRDGQPETGTAVMLTVVAADLRKDTEHVLLLVVRDTDPRVDHITTQPHPGIGSLLDRDLVRDAALLRELHGVAQQVDHHLTQAQRVSDQPSRYVGCEAAGKPQAFLSVRGANSCWI